jgi:hypothetical protein
LRTGARAGRQRFARSGLIEPEDVRDMLAWESSGVVAGCRRLDLLDDARVVYR